MKIIKDNLRLVSLSTVTCLCVLFSVPNYSSEPEEPEENSPTQTLQEYYLDFWYWMEGISLAQFMLSEERYADRSLDLEDLKRIYTLSFTASHVLDPYLFNLRNAFYSAVYQQGNPYREADLPLDHKKSHSEYIGWLQGLHKFMSPYHTDKDVGKNFKQVFEDTYKDSYPSSYHQYKHLLVHYDEESQPHIAGLGRKRAEQWLKYEIADEIISETEVSVTTLKNLCDLQLCKKHSSNNTSTVCTVEDFWEYDEACISALVSSPLMASLEAFNKRSLIKKLLPDVAKQIRHIVHMSQEELYMSPKIIAELFQTLKTEREASRPPYGIASVSLKFSRVEKLRTAGLHLHTISTLTLAELEQLRQDLTLYRATISGRAITPVILLRELGISLN